MIIAKSRIRNLSRYLDSISTGENIIVGIKDIERFPKAIAQLDFDITSEDGTTKLPSTCFGPISKFNAEGDYLIHKDKPKEIAYREQWWTLEDWGGYEHSGYTHIPYERYPRTKILPPGVEITVTTDNMNQKILLTERVTYEERNYELILHIINLFLEIFGECNIMKPNLEPFWNPKIQRLNWNILPKGEMPWEKLEPKLKPIVKKQSESNQAVYNKRFKNINDYKPNFVAIGQGGFYGYVVFGFPQKNLYILESTYSGNATYVFGDDWKTLSQMTKADILNNDLHKDRLIHREGWEGKLDNLF